MHSITFWKSWPDAHQRLFWIFAVLAIFSLGYLWYGDFTAPAPVIEALRAPEIDAAPFSHHSFRLGAFDMSLPADALIILERTVGGPLTPNYTGGFIFLSVLVLALMGILTVITTLSKFWFFTGLGFFTLLVVALRLETIELFGSSGYVPVAGVALAYAALTGYFGILNSRISFLQRFVAYVLLTAAIAVLVHFFAGAANPFARISANAMVVGTVLTIIFIFTVAHEILAAMIGVVSRGTRQTKSLQHFLVISSVYLINLGLIYANRKFLIHWEFLTINLMIFITVSGILGLWGFRNREPQYEAIFKANPSGVLIYLCLAAIGFVSMGYFFATANDPVIRLSEDAIVYSHLGYGIIFMIYVINNFGSMLYKNLQAYKMLYKPEHMPYFTFRLAGLICTFVFFAYSHWRASVNQVYAGYYNAWGDVYITQDTLNLSESYYHQSTLLSIRNYHAHYGLAQLAAGKDDLPKVKEEYSLLVNSRPIDLAYLNLSTAVQTRQTPSVAMSVLRDGLKDFPNNGRLQNELGLDFAELNQADSALHYIQAASKSREIRSVAETNRMGLAVKFFPQASLDSLLNISDKDVSGVNANALAMACVQGSTRVMPPVLTNDTVLSVYQVLSLHNYLMSRTETPDTALTEKAIRLARKSDNPYYRDFLLSAASFSLYTNGQTARAIKLLREAAFAGQVDNLFNALGLWSLEQNVPANATRYFDEAIKQEFQPAVFNKAISLSEEGNLPLAIETWQSLLTSKDSVAAHRVLAVLRGNPPLEQLDDEGKYLFIRYRIGVLDIAAFERAVNSIADADWKVKAVVDRSRQLDEAGELAIASATLAAISGIPVKDPEVFQEVLHLQLLIAAQQKNWPVIEAQLKNKKVSFAGKYRVEKRYLETILLASKSAAKTPEATKNYQWLIDADPFLEDAVVAAIGYLGKDNPEQLKLYSSLVGALDLNPASIKLLKVYAVMSLNLDFPDAGQSTLDRLKTMMSREAFLAFLQEYPDLFQVGAN